MMYKRMENQASVAEWGNRTFPHETNGPKKIRRWNRLAACTEEMIELMKACGLSEAATADLLGLCVRRVYDQEPDGRSTQESLRRETADLNITLMYLAEVYDIDLDQATDEAMQFNRSRPQAYYDARTAQKRLEKIRKAHQHDYYDEAAGE